MPKYRDYVRQMFDAHEKEFEEFAQVHAMYVLEPSKHQEEFNRVGAPIADILRDWERRLCGHSEKGNFAKYSANLAEKFRAEVKAFFPFIDFIGAKTTGSFSKQEPVINEPTILQTEDKDLEEIEKLSLDDFELPKLF